MTPQGGGALKSQVLENASTIRKGGKRKYGKLKYKFAGLEYASKENISID